jgi:hypothetical protein
MSVATAIPFYLTQSCGFWPIDEDDTPYQNAVTPAASFLGSLVFSMLLQDNILYYHSNDKYNMFVYSVLFFVISGCMIFWIPRYENTCEFRGDIRDMDGV